MNVKCLSACLLLLGAATALGEPPRVPVTMDPNDPQERRTIISRAEREQLGLTPGTWTGVVDPEVYATLERLNETIERLKETRSADPAMTLFLMQFPGTVYVEVQLKNDPDPQADSEEKRAAIRKTQRRVLRSLTAAEFHVRQLFERAPGLVGYAAREALDKLAAHPDVAGLCLDDQALPEKPKTIYKDDLPPAKPGEAADEPGVADGKVDPDVYRAFALTDRVDVRFSLRGDSRPPLTHVGSDKWARDRLREEASRQLRDRFLASFNADEFWVWTIDRGGLFIWAFVNKEGLEKLRQHPDVLRMRLPELLFLGPELSPLQR